MARTRAGTFSLGMGQRLGIASARLGDPPTVVLEEPLKRLDPEGSRWVPNAEIVRRLHLSEATVKTHLTRVLAELALWDRVQIVIFGYEHGLVGE